MWCMPRLIHLFINVILARLSLYCFIVVAYCCYITNNNESIFQVLILVL